VIYRQSRTTKCNRRLDSAAEHHQYHSRQAARPREGLKTNGSTAMSRQQHLGLTPLYLDGYVQIWTLAQRGAETRHDILSSWHRRNVSSNGDVGVTCLDQEGHQPSCSVMHINGLSRSVMTYIRRGERWTRLFATISRNPPITRWEE
jgi:hypothetical protein